MAESMPLILSAGLFDSDEKFPGASRTQLRLVTTYELEYFFTPGGSTVINGREYSLHPGRLLLSKPGDIRCSQLPFRCLYVHFSLSDPGVCEALNNCSGCFTVKDPRKTEEAFRQIGEQYYAPEPLERLSAGASLVLLLQEIASAAIEDRITLSRARKYIETNYREDLTVTRIAENCNVSASYLHRIFRNQLHTTPGDMLLRCRISAAKSLLVNTSLTLAQVAEACGFHSQSYFSDCFKRNTGCSPNSYRKNAAYPL
jgi:AraC-like DNA-binding protein